MKRLALALVLLATPALAQSTDTYWQQLLANKEAQSSQQIVELARQLDIAKAEIANLKKQLEPKPPKKDDHKVP